MARRTLSRRALRDQHDGADGGEQEHDEDSGDGEEGSATEKGLKKPRVRKTAAKPKTAKGPAKPRAPRKKTVKVPPRMFAKWAVCDNGMKRVAVFEYKDRAGADAKLAELRERKTGFFCLQLVKDAYVPPPEPAAV
jgi:hypothetical protein